MLSLCSRVQNMYLYGLTLQRASQITQAVHGNFTGTKQQVVMTPCFNFCSFSLLPEARFLNYCALMRQQENLPRC